MDKRQPPRRVPPRAIATIGALILAIGGGTVWLALNSRTPTPAPIPTSANSMQAVPVQDTADIYWLQDRDNKFELVARPVTLDKAASKNPSAILEQAFIRLLAGPSDTNDRVSTSIPKGTKLRSVTVQNDGVSVDLSQEFMSGGGSASMTGRLGQVIYTATSLNPNAKVFISVDGKRLETLGGEGLVLEQPLTRQGFQKDFPL
ncbi:GerMN domain-containing protein [Argonema galeatum]|uniref:GerMN domain-containing protein n=1 Tax=Argonema galeatum TaxID=2942762 RepID=UPI002013334F|nr:GerMN domain-containing protein [Argonema galeatum]MCL1462930.1 GerMN domain-containing protein [Argonema galeatum A003/A1]